LSGRPYRSELLSKEHKRRTFSCGVEALDRYFHERVGQDRRRDLAISYVLLSTATGEIAGYYSLSNYSIVPATLPTDLTRGLPHYDAYPAIRIGRLATDQRYRGRGVGRLLLLDALSRCLDVSSRTGVMAVVVDAKDEAARGFYEHFGFIRFPDQEFGLFLLTKSIPESLAND
jgi:GNAT superfamily N-acetyltransferase